MFEEFPVGKFQPEKFKKQQISNPLFHIDFLLSKFENSSRILTESLRISSWIRLIGFLRFFYSSLLIHNSLEYKTFLHVHFIVQYLDIYLKMNYQKFECKAQFTVLNNGVEAIPDYVLNALDNGAEVCRGKLA